MTSEPHSDAERDTIAWKNEQELLRLMSLYSLHIPAENFRAWRPTVRNSGDIPGVWQNATIIATDGLQAYFLLDFAEEQRTLGDYRSPVVIGHIQHFTSEVKTLFGKTPPIKPAGVPKARKRNTPFQAAMELLKSLRPKE